MCCFNAIIFFDFGVVVSIHLSCSHITVSGWQCNVGDKNKNSYYELPSVQPDEGFFFTRPPFIRISPVGAIGHTSCESMLDQTPAPMWGGDVCFSRGEAFSFLLFRFLLDLFLFSVFSFEINQSLAVHSDRVCTNQVSQQRTA